MVGLLKNHPFAVEAFFERSVVLTFSAPAEELKHLIPDCLELDTHNDRYGFVAVAMVQTKDLRPKGFPKFMGNDFFLIGYRVFVRYTSTSGKRLRGLYILKSETDNKKMELLGNVFTRYRYTTTDINVQGNEFRSKRSGFYLKYKEGDDTKPLPPDSPFGSWKEARRFAGPLPFTFSYDSGTKNVLIVEGVRENWIPVPIEVLEQDFSFIRSLNIKNCRLANAFILKDIPYYWKKGRTESWK